MKHKMVIRAITIAGLLATLAASVVAGTPVRLTFRDTTIASGSTLSYPIHVDSSLSGYTVSSYQIQFNYNTSLFKFVGATAVGTIAATWGTPSVRESPAGTVYLSSAGSDTLVGTGKLVILQFTSNLFTGPYTQGGAFSFVVGPSTIFNEGFPTTSFRNGTVTLTPGPSISISPNTSLLTTGDVQQFGVSGGKSPYRWSSASPTVGQIDSVTGILTAQNAGFTKVFVKDSSGYIDSTGAVEVRAFKLSFRDTSCYENQTIDVPVYCTSLTGLGVTSGQLQIVYDQFRWTPVQTIESGGILAPYGVSQFSYGGGVLSISFAGSSPLSGSGILLHIRMKASGQSSGGATASFQNVLFNEGYVANATSGYLTVLPLAPVTVTPSGAHTMVVGDSLQFSGSGGVLPYTWSVSGTGAGTISSTGLFKPSGSGLDTIKVMDSLGGGGASGQITVYDFRISIPDTSISVSGSTEIPIYVTGNSLGVLSYDLLMTYTTGSHIFPDSVDFGGTLSSGMLAAKSFHGDTIAISAAGVNKFYSGGTLLNVRFAIPDSAHRPTTIYINFLGVRFNEGIPLALPKNGSFQVLGGPTFSMSPTTASLFTAVGHQDSAIFTVYNTGIVTLTSSISVIGPSSFTVSKSNLSVAPGDSTKVTAYFQPTSPGPANAVIRFTTNDASHLQVDANVSGSTPYPIVVFSASSIDFGSVRVGQFKDTTVTISNTGTDTLKIMNVLASIPSFIARPTVANILPGHSMVDTIRFAPSGGGTFIGRITVTSNSTSNHDTVGVSGTGTTLFPFLSLSNATVNFGSVKAGLFKDTSITITNNGADTLKISGITSSIGVFSARPTIRMVLPGQFFKDTLRFAPALVGGYSGRLFVTSNAASSPDTITVSGTGIPLNVVVGLSNSSVNFGSVHVGGFKDTSITITNTGTDTLIISAFTPSNSVFSARPAARTVLPGQSFSDTLRFAPTLPGGSSGRILITSNAATSPDSISVSGTGFLSVALVLSRSTINFGSVKVGQFKDTTVTVTNTGTDTLKISAFTPSSGVFSARPVTRTVPPGQSFADTLRFTPSSAGGFSGRITITSNASTSPDSISVSGTGTPTTGVIDLSQTPDAYSLEQNYPNPFNPSTNIVFGLRARSTVRLIVFNILGQKVDELVNGEQNEGYHIVTWNPSVPSGAYFYRIEITSINGPNDHFTQIRKMILMK